METSYLPEALTLVGHDLNLSDEISNLSHENVEQFRQWLANQIAYKMETDMEGFLQALYRIDISEKKAMQALSNQTELPPALALADLVIEREIQKINTRRWYKTQQEQQQTNTDEPDDIVADTWD
jgi:ribosome-associated translation inhibitor RaiA